MHAVADLRTGAFRTSVVLPHGIGTIRMIRILDTAWTKAAPAFWTYNGYTREVAREVRGKWVVERTENIKELVSSLDPTVAIRALLGFRQSDVVGLDVVRSGAHRGGRVLRFGSGDETQRVVFTRGAKPKLLQISSTRGSKTTVVDITSLSQVRVDLPRSKDVFQASS
ncbi:MAG: hypothetical protein JWQ74_1867 [Marmoricola sp.]|nr:hypothetical protein [Marmoricola sp.]